jgi:hypothetical protein
MITWLTQLRFGASAKRLDNARLRSQIENAENILGILEAGDSASKAQQDLEEVRMWRGYEMALALYGMQCCLVAVSRHLGSNFMGDGVLPFKYVWDDCKAAGMDKPEMPPWAVDVDIVRSHRSRLIVLDPAHYGPQFPGTPKNMPVLWPQLVKSDPRGYRLRLKTNSLKALNSGTCKLPPHLYYDPNKNEVCKRAQPEGS